MRLAASAMLAMALGLSSVSGAQDADGLARARALLAEASAALEAARAGGARLAALGRAVRAHEAALAALRAGLRTMAATEQHMTKEIDTEAAKLEQLITGLQSLSRAPASALLAVRGGPLETSRAAMLIAAVTPELDQRVAELGHRLDALRELRLRQEEARVTARGALAGLQELRAGTAEALERRDRAGLAARADLRRQAKAAAERARDLADLAAALKDAGAAGSSDFGQAGLPVAGQVSAEFGDPDPWGRPGHGWSIEAPAFSQVTAPWDATVRYAGPLIDYGQVVVLEPEPGYLVVIAGLANVARSAGETVLAGEKLGDMGGALPTGDEFLLDAAAENSQIKRETLYLEIRRAGKPLDPGEWFDRKGSEAIR